MVETRAGGRTAGRTFSVPYVPPCKGCEGKVGQPETRMDAGFVPLDPLVPHKEEVSSKWVPGVCIYAPPVRVSNVVKKCGESGKCGTNPKNMRVSAVLPSFAKRDKGGQEQDKTPRSSPHAPTDPSAPTRLVRTPPRSSL